MVKGERYMSVLSKVDNSLSFPKTKDLLSIMLLLLTFKVLYASEPRIDMQE